MKALEMLQLCIGKTVQAVSVQEPRDRQSLSGIPGIYGSFSLLFTDGSSLDVQEAGQEGEIEIELVPAQTKAEEKAIDEISAVFTNDPEVKTATTNGNTIRINRAWFLALSPEEQRKVLYHETAHAIAMQTLPSAIRVTGNSPAPYLRPDFRQ